MDDIERVEQFEKSWAKFRKDEVVFFNVKVGRKQQRTFVGFAVQLATIQIVLGVSIGKQKGLIEEARAIDFTQKIAVDRLLLWKRGAESALFVPIREMRQSVRQGSDPKEVCISELNLLLAAWKQDTSEAERLIRLEAMGRNPTRVGPPHTVSGGLPSLGKRK